MARIELASARLLSHIIGSVDLLICLPPRDTLAPHRSLSSPLISPPRHLSSNAGLLSRPLPAVRLALAALVLGSTDGLVSVTSFALQLLIPGFFLDHCLVSSSPALRDGASGVKLESQLPLTTSHAAAIQPGLYALAPKKLAYSRPKPGFPKEHKAKVIQFPSQIHFYPL